MKMLSQMLSKLCLCILCFVEFIGKTQCLGRLSKKVSRDVGKPRSKDPCVPVPLFPFPKSSFMSG